MHGETIKFGLIVPKLNTSTQIHLFGTDMATSRYISFLVYIPSLIPLNMLQRNEYGKVGRMWKRIRDVYNMLNKYMPGGSAKKQKS